MAEDNYEELFGLAPKKKGKTVNVVDKLTEVPVKDKGPNMPHFQPIAAGICQQADLLFLPEDGGYKYALVVADIGGHRLVDAEPIKTKDAATVLEAFQKIYERKIIPIPSSSLEVDPGSEFKGVVQAWFGSKGVHIRTGKTGRHRQQAIVERKNQMIGKALFRRMSAQEVLTGEVSKEWVTDLPKLITVLNKIAERKKLKKIEDFPDIPAKGSAKILLEKGDKVRAILEQPKDKITGKVLNGKFRSTDDRWAPKERTIKEVLIGPGLPPQYLLEGNTGKRKVEPVAYTKNQLQLIKPNEVYPEGDKVIRGTPKTYIIENILQKKKVKGKIFYEIKWRGFKATTWEPRVEIIKDQPKLVADFESKK